MFAHRSLVGSLSLVFLFGGFAKAELLTVTVDARDMGWYRQSPGDEAYHNKDELNYLVGRYTLSNKMAVYHNFFVFDLTGVDGFIRSAKLALKTLVCSNTPKTYELYNVATPGQSLIDANFDPNEVFEDLGGGAICGSCEVPGAPTSPLEIPLSSAFVEDANATSQFIAIGGALTNMITSTENEFLFKNNSQTRQLSDARLILTVEPIPEPGTLSLLLIGAASACIFACRRIRRA